MQPELVLSLFPGIGLLDRAFEEQGFQVVRGPDALWGGDIRSFHVPSGVFTGVIGGPPCQAHSRMRYLVEHCGKRVAEDLIPEFVRVVSECQPVWFVMENVPDAPVPQLAGYVIESGVFDNRQFGAEQHRERRISVGFRGRAPRVLRELVEWAPINGNWAPAVMAGSGRLRPVKIGGSGKVKSTWKLTREPRSFAESLRLQGLPPDFLADSPFTAAGRQKVVGNGVPLPMGRAIARAVRRALDQEEVTAP